jgi:hypothetical protein
MGLLPNIVEFLSMERQALKPVSENHLSFGLARVRLA